MITLLAVEVKAKVVVVVVAAAVVVQMQSLIYQLRRRRRKPLELLLRQVSPMRRTLMVKTYSGVVDVASGWITKLIVTLRRMTQVPRRMAMKESLLSMCSMPQW